MKKTAILLFLALFCFISTHDLVSRDFYSHEECQPGHIDTRGLKALLDSDISFVLIDARGDMRRVPNKIPTAQFLFYQDSPEKAEQLIPSLDSLIVVYCYSSTCPYSGFLIKELYKWGYCNIIEYSEGLKEWRDVAGYPIE